MNAVLRPLLEQADSVRRATQNDVPRLARLFTAVFASDPVFAWLTRPGCARHAALEQFFLRILKTRTIPHGETWLAANGLAAAAWIPPYSPLSSPSLLDDLSMVPTILRLTGLLRLPRGVAMAAAMADSHPDEACFYLAFIGVAPRLQGAGLGSLLLERTLARVDAVGAPAYLENSNPRNLSLYERAGFGVTREIRAGRGAPPLLVMRRPARALPAREPESGSLKLEEIPPVLTSDFRPPISVFRTRQGSSTMSQ